MSIYSLGIDIGYTSVKIVLINQQDKIVYKKYKAHLGKIENTFKSMLFEVSRKFMSTDIAYGSITGNLNEIALINNTNGVEAAIEGSIYLNPSVKSIIEIGGQSAKYFTGVTPKENTLKLSSNSDCAAGTGAFLEEQALRLNIKIEDFSEYAQKAKTIPRIAGRCSVFAKTDIIHNQQEGVSSADILKGLAYAVVKNYKTSVIRQLPVEAPVLFIGGVGKNNTIVDALRDVLGKTELELIVPKHFEITGAIGAALIAKRKKLKFNFRMVSRDFKITNNSLFDDNILALNKFKDDDVSDRHEIKSNIRRNSDAAFYLGVDVGSTSVNLVLITDEKEVVYYDYIRTNGDLDQTLKMGFKRLSKFNNGKLRISRIGVTGSGRQLIGKNIGADIIKDEITAQAKAATEINPEVDTIFEIGGQDSKFISIRNGMVIDFQMNKVCAAGTGSFLDQQAQKFNIPIHELGKIALKGKQPVNLGERCTVFIESNIASSLSNGVKEENIVSGLCYSIAKNYLHRVVGQKKIGNKIFIQGGIAYNQGVVNALKIITQKDIQIPPFFSVTGAYGVAIIALEEKQGIKSKFVGFEQIFCKKLTKLKNVIAQNQINLNKFQNQTQKLIFDNYQVPSDKFKKTVGIPRSLFTFSMFPMYNSFFKSLGLNVLLSDWSDEKTIKRAQKYSMNDFCFPIKLITGHVDELVESGVDYIFFPNLYKVSKPTIKAKSLFGCPYMQQAGKLMQTTLELKNKGVQLLSPTYDLSQGKFSIKILLTQLAQQLGKTTYDVELAMPKCLQAMKLFESELAEKRMSLSDKLKNNKIVFVIISKMYGVSDPVLNLGIQDKLTQMGYPVVPFYELPMIDSSDEYPYMFWSFGHSILSAANYVSKQQNLFAIYLTHHGCGPDSALTHLFQKIMGDKPFLNIQTDEHSSSVGIETRIEAFVNSLSSYNIQSQTDKLFVKTNKIEKSLKTQSKSTKIYIPNINPYSSLIREWLIKQGMQFELLPQTNLETINLGKKYTLTNEYYSMAALLGDCFHQVINKNSNSISFCIPKTEGADVDALYSQLLRIKLDEENHTNINVLAPNLEDILKMDSGFARSIFRCLIAGDIILTAPYNERERYLDEIKALIEHNNFNVKNLCNIAKTISKQFAPNYKQKKILAIGEPMVVYSDFLNNFTFRNLEKQKCKIVYPSFAETIWLFLNDYSKQELLTQNSKHKGLLDLLKAELQIIAIELGKESPFVRDVYTLVEKADKTIGLFAGAFARYRLAKILIPPTDIDGIITVNSTYENTGVCLSTLYKSFCNRSNLPVINLSFDGTDNKNNKNKVESFMYNL